MQTFLPYANFEQSARVLDQKRLGKQRVEVIQIVRAITNPGYGWANHPAVLMWRGYEEALGRYGIVMCDVWTELGFGDSCALTITQDLRQAGVPQFRSQQELEQAGELPPWLGDEALHVSHRSALVRKDPDHYRPHFPDTPDDMAYLWPVRSENAIQLEQRKEENAKRRTERAIQKAAEEAEKLKRRRSRAAKKAWKTRRANQQPST